MIRADPNRFDLVVADLAMPKMGGEQLAVEMRMNRADIPIILRTGYSDSITPESSKSIGISGFLYKPFEIQELGRVVRNVLDEANSAITSKTNRGAGRK